MKKLKLGPTGLKFLKIIHIVLVALFFGGILSSTAINMGINLDSYEETLTSYKTIITISDATVRTGAVGTLLVGFIYSIFTNWGFFKFRWVTVKWILFIIQTIIGIFVVDKLMVANMTLLETQGSMALTNPIFIENHELRMYAVYIQIAITVFIFAISVIRPWKKKKTVQEKRNTVAAANPQ